MTRILKFECLLFALFALPAFAQRRPVLPQIHPFEEVPDPFAKPAQRITDELPVDVALGKLDYMEIVGFSDHKSTAEVWYKLLNLGFKLPAGGGTDKPAPST